MRTTLKETPFWRQTLGARILCSALFLVGLAAFAVATSLDVDYWVSVARTDLAKWEYGGGSIIFRSVSFLFAAVVAYQWRKGTLGSIVAGLFAAIVLASFASIGMSSVLGFGARERIVPYQQAEADAAAQRQAFEDSRARQLKLEDDALVRQHKLQDGQIDYLRRQASGSKRAANKQAAYDALGQATFGSVPTFKTEVITAPKIVAATDPQAEAIHELVPSWSINKIQLATTAAFGIGLIVAEMVCMGFAVGMWPKAAVPSRRGAATEVPDMAELKAEGTVIAPANVVYPPAYHLVQALVEEPQKVVAVQEELFNDGEPLNLILTPEETVEAFWSEATRPAAAARIGATAMHRAYAAWCADRGLQPSSSQKFGRVSRGLCDKDERSKSATYYIGRAILSTDQNGDGEPELLMAA